MSEWAGTTLGEVCELKRGYDLPKRERRDGPYPIVSSSGTTGYHAESKVEAPGVVTGRYGTLGQVFFVAEDFWPLNTSLYVRDFKGNNPRFVAALLESMDLERHDGAAAVPGLNRNQLHDLPVLRPDRDTQDSIAAVLEAIDGLVENNRRRIEVLEEMAQVIYREWFVHFRYPGHERATFVDSPLGPIPEGWEAMNLGDCSENFDRLRKPLSRMERASRPGPYPYYGAAKLIDWVDDWIFDGEYLLFAEDGSVETADGYPVLQLIDCKFWPNNHTHILQGTGVSTRFLYLASQRQPISAYVTGAAQPKITQRNLKRVPIIRPDAGVLGLFEQTVDPVMDEWRSLQRQSAPLTAIRDLLLPKLVTGEIEVLELDLDALGEAAS